TPTHRERKSSLELEAIVPGVILGEFGANLVIDHGSIAARKRQDWISWIDPVVNFANLVAEVLKSPLDALLYMLFHSSCPSLDSCQQGYSHLSSRRMRMMYINR